MSVYEVVDALSRVYGVRLRLDAEKTRLLIPRDDAARLPEELKQAIRDHKDELLRGTLFKDGVLELQRYMTKTHGADPEGPAYAAGIAGVGADGTHEALNAAWDEADLEGFKEALSEYLRAGARAFRDARREGEAADREPPLPLLEHAGA